MRICRNTRLVCRADLASPGLIPPSFSKFPRQARSALGLNGKCRYFDCLNRGVHPSAVSRLSRHRFSRMAGRRQSACHVRSKPAREVRAPILSALARGCLAARARLSKGFRRIREAPSSFARPYGLKAVPTWLGGRQATRSPAPPRWQKCRNSSVDFRELPVRPPARP